MAIIPLAGDRFNRLVVTGTQRIVEEPRKDRANPNRRVVLECVCDCGSKSWVQPRMLVSGRTLSCGCARRDGRQAFIARKWAPGREARQTRQHLRRAIRAAINRCHNPKAQSYARYGARGIEVCAEWREDLEAFCAWAARTGFKNGDTLDRRDNDGPYSPDNCRWATMVQQGRNRRDNVVLTAFGEEKPLSEWVADPRCNFSRSALRHRLERGLTFEEALTLPRQPPGKRPASVR